MGDCYRNEACWRFSSEPISLPKAPSVSATVEPEAPAIDEVTWAELVDLMVDGDDATEVIDTVAEFLSDASASMEKIHDAYLQQDETTLRKAAHRLKSACGNLGALSMARLLADLEAAAAPITSTTATLVLRTREEWRRVESDLHARCLSLNGASQAF